MNGRYLGCHLYLVSKSREWCNGSRRNCRIATWGPSRSKSRLRLWTSCKEFVSWRRTLKPWRRSSFQSWGPLQTKNPYRRFFFLHKSNPQPLDWATSNRSKVTKWRQGVFRYRKKMLRRYLWVTPKLEAGPSSKQHIRCKSPFKNSNHIRLCTKFLQ